MTQQTPLQLDKQNEGWGDLHQYVNPQNHFWVVSKNVSTLNPQSIDMVAITTELSMMQASLFCAQETNTAWNPLTLQAFKNQCQKVYPHHKLAVLSSQEKNDGWFQPGGTRIITLGVWTSRVIGWGCNELLGRWSYLKMVGQNDKCAILVSAYQVCAQEFDATTNTLTVQQTWLLMQKGIPKPHPRQQFITDLIAQIQQWQQQQKEILISMDTNEDVDNPKSKISCIFAETDLVDIHQYWHPGIKKPATHQCRSAPIDLMLGTTLFAIATTAVWMLPFGNPPLIKGDHWLIGMDFHPGILFGSTPLSPANGMIRGLNS